MNMEMQRVSYRLLYFLLITLFQDIYDASNNEYIKDDLISISIEIMIQLD